MDSIIKKLLKDCKIEHKTLGEVCNIESGRLNANAAVENGLYPFFTTSKKIYKINDYVWDCESLLVSGNADIGEVKHYNGKFNAYQRTYVLTNFDNSINVKYLFYVLKNSLKSFLQKYIKKSAMQYILIDSVKKFKFFIPPISVQNEIVKLLDKFTESKDNIISNLQKELKNHNNQYKYYRDKLLTFDDSVKFKPLEEVTINIIAPSKIKKEKYQINGKIPIIDQGIEYISGYTNNNISTVKLDKYIIFGDHSEHIKYVDFEFIQGADGLKILKPISDNPKYIYYTFINFYKKELGYKRHWLKAKKTLLPIPNILEQERIVNILDKFTLLNQQINIKLQKEIDLTEKQYEYYRNKLLSF